MRLVGSLHPFALVLVLVTAAAGACAHDAPPAPDPYVDNGVASIRAWLKQLPRCPPLAEATDLASLQPDPNAMVVAVRGLLTLTANPVCTRMACGGGGKCCNRCSPAWVVVPDGSSGPTQEIALQRSGEEHEMSASAKDCAVDAIRQQIPKSQVIVSGWLENEDARRKIIRASLCVVERTTVATPAPTP